MSFELLVDAAIERAFQKQVMPLLQPVLEQMKFVNIAKQEPVDELWDTKQVASFLKLAPITIELWRTEGRGPDFLRVTGNRVRYKKSVVVEFAERNQGLIGRKGRPPSAIVEQVRRNGLAINNGGRAKTTGRVAQAGK